MHCHGYAGAMLQHAAECLHTNMFYWHDYGLVYQQHPIHEAPPTCCYTYDCEYNSIMFSLMIAFTFLLNAPIARKL